MRAIEELNRELHKACLIEDIDQVKELVGKGADVDSISDHGHTPLNIACIKSNILLVKYLVEQKADINKLDEKGQGPLHNACVNCCYQDAIDNENIAIVFYLVENGADLNLKATYEGDPDFTMPLERSTPLAIACLSFPDGLTDQILRYLIKEGADINDVDCFKNTALHHLVDEGQDIVEFLVENGVDINAQNSHGDTALAASDLMTYSQETLDYLLQSGAKLHGVNFHAANMRAFNFIGADFENASLDKVNFNNVILIGAKMNGTPIVSNDKRFENAIVTVEQLIAEMKTFIVPAVAASGEGENIATLRLIESSDPGDLELVFDRLKRFSGKRECFYWGGGGDYFQSLKKTGEVLLHKQIEGVALSSQQHQALQTLVSGFDVIMQKYPYLTAYSWDREHLKRNIKKNSALKRILFYEGAIQRGSYDNLDNKQLLVIKNLPELARKNIYASMFDFSEHFEKTVEILLDKICKNKAKPSEAVLLEYGIRYSALDDAFCNDDERALIRNCAKKDLKETDLSQPRIFEIRPKQKVIRTPSKSYSVMVEDSKSGCKALE